MAATDLNTLLEALQSAVTTAQHICENQHLDDVGDFWFDKDGRPKTRRVLLKADGGGKDIEYDVPLFALIPHGSIRIKEMRVKFKTQLSSVIEAKEGAEGREGRSRLGASFGGGLGWWPFGGGKRAADDVAEVEVVFSSTDPPEAIMKLNGEIVRRML